MKMRLLGVSARSFAKHSRFPTASRHVCPTKAVIQRDIFTSSASSRASRRRSAGSRFPLAVITGGLFIWWLYPSDDFKRLSSAGPGSKESPGQHGYTQRSFDDESPVVNDGNRDESAWADFAQRFEALSAVTDVEWSSLSDKLVEFIIPEWSKLIPGYVRKLQRELSMSPGSLADEIWQDAHDPDLNPEIRYSAEVRVSSQLCSEETEFLNRRRRVTRAGLARYLGIQEKDIHPDDIPTIAMCGSGGGLRALIAGTGSLLACEEDGLFDCVTFTSGVSGSCWLQLLYLSSFNKGSVRSLLDHLKARASTHIAYPPVAFQALTSLPTSKALLSGMVEKLKGDPHADFGLVDVYGLLLAARYLVPKGDLGVNDRDFKLSNQRDFIKYGQNPMPIYTAVRHEIPDLDKKGPVASEKAKEKAKQEGWFQWYEMTPYEVFCEEFGAGVPTWAFGRKFSHGKDVPSEEGFHLPELRMPLLMGIFGSAFCASLKHYYQEIKPLVRSMSGFKAVDELVSGRNKDLSKVHPIDPAHIANFTYKMQGSLPKTTPEEIYESEYIQLMDAGMSNNLPIYPLLRPGRDVDVIVAFDASADVKTDNWLAVADGYARQRGITGWPVGIGWPRPDQPSTEVVKELEEARADTPSEATAKVQKAKSSEATSKSEPNEEAGDLGYCTVWVGTTQERSSQPPPPSKAITDANSWALSDPDAGIAVVYLPLLANDKVPGVSPGTTDYLSTWNFVYKPDQVDRVVDLAKANYGEGRDQIKSTVRAVYERKKMLREEKERTTRRERYRDIAGRGEEALLGEGDQFS